MESKKVKTTENPALNKADVMPSLPLEVISLLKQVRFIFSNYESGTIGKIMSEDADGLLKQYAGNGVSPYVSNRTLWRIEPYFDGISTAVTTYKVVDQNGTMQFMGDRSQCEYFLQYGL